MIETLVRIYFAINIFMAGYYYRDTQKHGKGIPLILDTIAMAWFFLPLFLARQFWDYILKPIIHTLQIPWLFEFYILREGHNLTPIQIEGIESLLLEIEEEGKRNLTIYIWKKAINITLKANSQIISSDKD